MEKSERERRIVCACVCTRTEKTVGTWLILPVVICLSQRLSHACLSISLFIRRDCGWLIKSVIVYLMVSFFYILPTWITVVILELIHAQGPEREGRGLTRISSLHAQRDVFIRLKTSSVSNGVSHNW